MRAIQFHEHGELDTLRLEDVSEPVPGPGEALVRVRACGVNYLDLRVREGRVGGKVPLPHIPGSEVAGEVAALGEGVSGVSVGQRVAIAPYLFCGRCEYCLAGDEVSCLRGDILGLGGDGGYAEQVVAPAQNLIPLPEELSFEAAAAVSLATLTAWHMLVDRAEIRPGETVLVLAAGGGVGSAAVQIAKLAGARVIATAGSEEKLQKARELGADETVNYREQDFLQEVKRLTGKRGVDVVVEHIGADTWEKSVACLTRGGRLVTCGTTSGTEGKTDLWQLYAKQLKLIGSYGGNRGELRTVLSLVAQGKLKPVIDRVLPLERAAEAQRIMAERRQFGKIILAP